MNGDFKGM